MKAVLISIRPKWCELIASGKKTVEVRKSRPKLETPFKVYIYCTKNTRKHAFHTYINSGYGRKNFGVIGQWRSGKEIVDVNSHLPAYRYSAYLAEGKVIGEFVCDWLIGTCPWRLKGKTGLCAKRTEKETNLPDMACLTLKEIDRYAGSEGRGIYAWHISDLVIYDEPRGVGGFFQYCGDNPKCDGCEAHYYSNTECGKEDYCCSIIDGCKPIKRPPQSWCYVEE